MNFIGKFSRQPRAAGIACAIGAVLLGLAYMAMAGAPVAYLAINAGALFVGLAMWGVAARFTPKLCSATGVVTLAMATGLLMTSLFGVEVEGAARWISLGGLGIQPSLILLPAMIVGFAVSRDAPGRAAMIVAAVALAIQPDRAMAGMLAAGLAVMAVTHADRFVLPAFAASIIGFAATLVRADGLPAMPFVDQILYTSFDVHVISGLAVLVGSALLVVPAIAGWRHDPENRDVYLVFGVVWLTAILAAALGNYPTPLVGYSGAAVLGYVLSLVALPSLSRERSGANAGRRAKAASADVSDRSLSIGLARSA